MELSPRSMIGAKALYIRLKFILLQVIARSGFLSAAYYSFLSTAYSRERRAVAAGLLHHLKRLKTSASLFNLRRNIHRIEKGLVMPDRRPVFALEYIGETVTYYLQCLDSCTSPIDRRELGWATDILRTYFDTCAAHPIIDEQRARFLAIESAEAGTAVPYLRGEQPCPVTAEELLALAQRRKSVRVYLDKPVPRELIDQALAIASVAPSSCNRQPTIYRLYDDPELVRELSLYPLGTAGFADNIPMICAVTGDLSAYFYERDRHSIYVDGCLSAMLFMLALETVGLASCPLNWPEVNSLDRKLEKRLGLPPHERAIMFMAIGYADPQGRVAYSEKKSLDQLRSYNWINSA